MNAFERTIQLIGEDAFEQLQRSGVILFGVGGVGGWTAESLLRTGVGHLTLVDFDTVQESNLNRQVVATSSSLGQLKAVAMQQRLLSILPSADVEALLCRYDETTYPQFDFTRYDLVIDAIDQVDSKVRLIHEATASATPILCSMGAGRKLDPTQVRTAEFWKVAGCPLARAIRHKMKRMELYPEAKFQCVYSAEQAGPAGTLAPVVATFGNMLAGLAVQRLLASIRANNSQVRSLSL